MLVWRPRGELPCTPPAGSHTTRTPHKSARRSDLAALRREVKTAVKDWEREQALYAEVLFAVWGLQYLMCARVLRGSR